MFKIAFFSGLPIKIRIHFAVSLTSVRTSCISGWHFNVVIYSGMVCLELPASAALGLGSLLARGLYPGMSQLAQYVRYALVFMLRCLTKLSDAKITCVSDTCISMGHWWNDTDVKEPRYSRENLSGCHFVHHKSHLCMNSVIKILPFYFAT